MTIKEALDNMALQSTEIDDGFRWQMLRHALIHIAEQMGCDPDQDMED